MWRQSVLSAQHNCAGYLQAVQSYVFDDPGLCILLGIWINLLTLRSICCYCWTTGYWCWCRWRQLYRDLGRKSLCFRFGWHHFRCHPCSCRSGSVNIRSRLAFEWGHLCRFVRGWDVHGRFGGHNSICGNMWACYVGWGWAIIFILAIQAILPAITKRPVVRIWAPHQFHVLLKHTFSKVRKHN